MKNKKGRFLMLNMKDGNLIVICGPSGVGKGTICKEFLQNNKDIKLSISATTRNPRVGEVDGVNYHFLDKDIFKKMMDSGDFLEYAQVYDNFYGTPKQNVMDNLKKGENVLLEIDIQGAMQVKKQYPQGIFVFILPPSLSELRNRIEGRATDAQDVIEKRLSCAFDEIMKIDEYDYYIVNDDLQEAVRELECIVRIAKNKVDKNLENILNHYKEEL